jgi:hypothetical protein
MRFILKDGMEYAGECVKIEEHRMGKVNRLMTTSGQKKAAQASNGEKETAAADQIDEYKFFISANGDNQDKIKKDNSITEAPTNGMTESKQGTDFFLPK